jgi:hypothetical protein
MAPGRFRALHQRRKEHAWPRANAWR